MKPILSSQLEPMTRLPSFTEFFRATHGFEPFPWQARLAEQVLAEGWPDLLDLPTGSGKTSSLDVALYCVAAAPERLPRRTVLVVDRRIVVDQAADHARELLKALRDAAAGPVKAIADALRATFWNGERSADPFAVAVMRGGMPRDNDWAKRPDQPVLGVSTVDQLGSRLLFRGYGVGPMSASIHAGLLGNDTLILLDEVHLAVPFAQTLSAIRKRYRNTPPGLPDRFGVVRMSATAGAPDPSWRVFGLNQADRDHPELSRRLTASKLARLVKVKVKGDDEAEKRRQLAKEAVEQALTLHTTARTIAIVVNRVDTARLAHQLLQEKYKDVVDSELVTGRMRPIDRDHFVREVLNKRIGPRKTRPEGPKPLILVATQCIEAGADLDFDGLVSECASLDALRQRFGRLDRQGIRRSSPAIILGRTDSIGPDADDPVYGKALSATWQWLERAASSEVVDFGITAMPAFPSEDGDGASKVLAPAPNAPVLLAAHLDAWAQTCPRPSTDPDVALWLHDPERSSAEVQLVWRSEVRLPFEDAAATPSLDEIVERLSARRPSSLEAITVPIFAARKWLAGESPPPIADVTAGALEPEGNMPRRSAPLPHQVVALRWSGEESDFIFADELDQLRPGDVLVIPSQRGGITANSFDPAGTAAVADVGDVAQLRARGRASLLLEAEALNAWALPSVGDVPAPNDEEAASETRDRIVEWMAEWPRTRPPTSLATDEEWQALTTRLGNARKMRTDVIAGRLLVTAIPRVKLASLDVAESITEDDDSSFRQREVSLNLHSRDVRDYVEGFAKAIGFDAHIVRDLRLSAWLHDVGKADSRFQRWLVGGDEVRALTQPEPLAKSALPAGNRASRQLARRRAGYPESYRHELLSLEMIEGNEAALAEAHDRELVLHLVASHHGWCRPFAPMSDHPDDFEVHLMHGEVALSGRTRHRKSYLDSGVGDRFWTLVTKYGWWGLAWLEAVLRLADHRASEMETQEPE
jgi:CRISPR-associated endonuclease/helicase Cas3